MLKDLTYTVPKIYESPHKTNSVCHDWRRCNNVYEFMSGYCGPDIGNHYKHQTYTVASGTSVTGSVFMRRSRLFLGTVYLRFFSKVFPSFLDLFFSKTDPWTNLRIKRLYMYNTSKKTSWQVCVTYFFFLQLDFLIETIVWKYWALCISQMCVLGSLTFTTQLNKHIHG